jgi:hypothetical protein
MGRHLRAAQKAHFGSGENSIQLNVSDLKAGIYYVRLRAGEAIETKSLIIQ